MLRIWRATAKTIIFITHGIDEAVVLPPHIVEIFLSRTGFGVHPLTPGVVADQQKIADTFYELKLIPRHLDIASVTWTPPA